MSEKLNIAFYTDSFLPAVDGVVISLLNFRKELIKRGHSVHVFAAGNSDTKKMTAGYDNVHIVRGIRFNKYPQYSIALLPLVNPADGVMKNFDITHLQTPFMMGTNGMINAKLNRSPIIGSFHTLFMDPAVIKEYTFKNKRMRKIIEKYSWRYANLFYNRCDTTIAPSNVISGMLKKHNIKNVSIVPNSVDTKLFNSKVDGSEIRESLGILNDVHVILYAGRVSREKRLETLIRSAALLKDEKFRFVIAGSGPALDHYKTMVTRYKLNSIFDFTGFVENHKLPAYYAAADAFCMPSTFETQGIVTLEAMACGKPVIGADYLALKELIVNGKNGEKFKPNDHYACARKIRKVIYNIGSYKDMLNTAKEYSIERTTDKLLDAYKKII